MPKKRQTDRMNLSIDLILKRQFTAVCTLKGLNMSDVVQELIADWLKENASPELLNAIQNEPDDNSPTSGSSGRGKGKRGKGE
jgi:antitoxin component of RelBE/YafQ-DinJ toxin-antitoxin module